MSKFIALFGVAGILFVLVLSVLSAALWIKGIVLAFSASVLLGIICIFIQVPFPVFAAAYWLCGVDLAQKIVDAFPQIFQ